MATYVLASPPLWGWPVCFGVEIVISKVSSPWIPVFSVISYRDTLLQFNRSASLGREFSAPALSTLGLQVARPAVRARRASQRLLGRRMLGLGRIFVALHCTAHPLHTRFTSIFGTFFSETVIRSNPLGDERERLLAPSATGRTAIQEPPSPL